MNNKPARFPRKMTIVTFLIATAVVLSFLFGAELEDAGVAPDVRNVMSVGVVLLLLIAWAAWCLLFSRWRWWRRVLATTLVLSMPFALFFVLRPVNNGDAGIARFEPIWMARKPVLATSVGATGEVDLATETPQDFPAFLGPHENAAVDGIIIDPAVFPNSQVVWKQRIGLGWSGFAARNGYAVTLEQRGDKECVTCYDIASGDLKWIHQHQARHKDQMNLGRTGPRSTPTIHDGLVYAVGAVGHLVCLNGATGQVVWQQDLNELLGIRLATGVADGFEFQYEENTSLAWGRAGSPLIVDDKVIVPGGGPRDGNKSTLLAFDRKTGDLLWRGGDEMIAYGSPVLATVAGRRQILLTAESKAMGFDPESGDVLWTHPRPGQSDAAANTSQVTVVSDTQVLTSKGYPDGGGELLRLTTAADAIVPQSIWSNHRVLKTKLTNPVLRDGHAFALSNGFLECTRLEDGQRVWRKRGRFGHGQILLVRDKLLVHSESGSLSLVDANPDEYRDYGSIPTIDGVCWNTLCLYGPFLLVRSELESACIRLPVRKPETL